VIAAKAPVTATSAIPARAVTAYVAQHKLSEGTYPSLGRW